MPLSHGKSKKAFVHNLKTEMEHGKPQKQALAIAYAMKRRKKMAEGGSAGLENQAASAASFFEKMKNPPPPPPPKYAKGGFVKKEKESGYLPMPEDHEKHNHAAMLEDDKRLGQHGAHEQGPVPCEYEDEESLVDRIMSRKSVDESNMDRLAYGGEAGDGSYMDDEQSLVDRIMHKSSMDLSDLDRYSRGGQVANQEHGEDNNDLAGFSPNEFDDLVLRDELESSYGDDDNAGDDIGNDREDHDREDIVARILRSQKKKDKLPRPA